MREGKSKVHKTHIAICWENKGKKKNPWRGDQQGRRKTMSIEEGDQQQEGKSKNRRGKQGRREYTRKNS